MGSGKLMSDFYHIIWEKRKQEEAERPYMQIPLPVRREPEKKPLNDEKDKEKRGVYIFQM